MSNTIHFSNSYKMSASRQVFESITVNRARELILAAVPQPTATITLPLAQSVGFVAAGDIAAANPLPTYTNSAMDGYAFRYEDISDATEVVLPIVGQSFAGAPCTALTFAHATCIEIATGAALPEALDTVIPFEKCDIDAKARTIRFSVDSVKHGANVRYEGEQIGRGEVIVQTGTLLRPQHLALLAAAGISEVTVHSRLRVALLTTGSELAEPGQPLGRYQTYNSNGVMLETMLKSMNCSVEAVSMQDNADIIAQKISELLTRNDMLILTGGAGNGKFDISQTQLNAMGTMHPGPSICAPVVPCVSDKFRENLFSCFPAIRWPLLSHSLNLFAAHCCKCRDLRKICGLNNIRPVWLTALKRKPDAPNSCAGSSSTLTTESPSLNHFLIRVQPTSSCSRSQKSSFVWITNRLNTRKAR